jgi:hypothetical protein
VTGNLLNTAQNMGQQYNNAAAATASGYIGGANAWSNGISGMTNNLTNLALISKMGGGSGSGGGSSAGYGAPPGYWAANGFGG